MSRNWNAHDKGGCIAIGEPGSYFTREVVLLNPDMKQWHKHAYVLWFGSVGMTYLHVYADGLEDALEECAEWLAEHAPGHIMKAYSEEHIDLIKDACGDAGIEYDPALFAGSSLDSELERVLQDAEADLTYTESGYLTSYEWGISLEDPDAATLYDFIKGT